MPPPYTCESISPVDSARRAFYNLFAYNGLVDMTGAASSGCERTLEKMANREDSL